MNDLIEVRFDAIRQVFAFTGHVVTCSVLFTSTSCCNLARFVQEWAISAGFTSAGFFLMVSLSTMSGTLSGGKHARTRISLRLFGRQYPRVSLLLCRLFVVLALSRRSQVFFTCSFRPITSGLYVVVKKMLPSQAAT